MTSKIEHLRLLITQRLTEAAEEIFRELGRTVAELEEELDRSWMEVQRQKRLLELSRRPRVSVSDPGAVAADPLQHGGGALIDELHIKQEEDEHGDETTETEQNNFLFQSDGPDEGRDLLDTQPGTSADVPDTVLVGGADLETAASPQVAVDTYVCSICNRAFSQRTHWVRHVQTHRRVGGAKADKSFTCPICGKRLTRFDGYQKHLRVHTGEKPYSCQQCGRCFSDNSNYKRHVRMHAAQQRARNSAAAAMVEAANR
ncbi:uncharacterized protein KZ484_005633 isoform 2-T2 [Pholidichthys leucotaenia]